VFTFHILTVFFSIFILSRLLFDRQLLLLLNLLLRIVVNHQNFHFCFYRNYFLHFTFENYHLSFLNLNLSVFYLIGPTFERLLYVFVHFHRVPSFVLLLIKAIQASFILLTFSTFIYLLFKGLDWIFLLHSFFFLTIFFTDWDFLSFSLS
jgi:hypothetical protein